MKVAAIVGPTAVGKSAIAMDVAQRLSAEIISMDSMQVYSGMDAGTAKPTFEMRERVPHHLLDIVPPSHELTAAEFQTLGRAAIEEVFGRARLPLLVGGSGLYFRAVVDRLEFPGRDPEIRAELERRARLEGSHRLHERLRTLDPVAATRIAAANTRRVVRALEAIEVDGRAFSANYAWRRYESEYVVAIVGLRLPRDLLYERIERRVDDMLSAGLVEEARALQAGGLGAGARQALGYRQVLDAASSEEEEVRDGIVRATKRFARRQQYWFQADPRVVWFDASETGVADSLSDHLARSLRLA